MKKTMTIILLFLAIITYGQKEFEGTIVFKTSVEGQDASKLQTMMPETYTFQIKNLDMKIVLQGGYLSLLMGPIIVKNGKTYMLKDDKKTAYRMPENAQKPDKPKSIVKVTKLPGTETILGYICSKYKVDESDDKGKKAVTYVWSTKAINVENFKKNQSTIDMQMIYEGIEGFPLKVVSDVQQQTANYKITMQVTKVVSEVLNNSVFQIPPEYKIEDFGPGAYIKPQF